MDSSTNLERLKTILADKSGFDETDINPDSQLTNDLELDSLDRVELVMAIEKEFNIAIPDSEAEKLTTVESLLNYINKNAK